MLQSMYASFLLASFLVAKPATAFQGIALPLVVVPSRSCYGWRRYSSSPNKNDDLDGIGNNSFETNGDSDQNNLAKMFYEQLQKQQAAASASNDDSTTTPSILTPPAVTNADYDARAESENSVDQRNEIRTDAAAAGDAYVNRTPPPPPSRKFTGASLFSPEVVVTPPTTTTTDSTQRKRSSPKDEILEQEFNLASLFAQTLPLQAGLLLAALLFVVSVGVTGGITDGSNRYFDDDASYSPDDWSSQLLLPQQQDSDRIDVEDMGTESGESVFL